MLSKTWKESWENFQGCCWKFLHKSSTIRERIILWKGMTSTMLSKTIHILLSGSHVNLCEKWWGRDLLYKCTYYPVENWGNVVFFNKFTQLNVWFMKKLSTIDTFIIPNTMYFPLLIVDSNHFFRIMRLVLMEAGRNEDLDSIITALQVWAV